MACEPYKASGYGYAACSGEEARAFCPLIPPWLRRSRELENALHAWLEALCVASARSCRDHPPVASVAPQDAYVAVCCARERSGPPPAPGRVPVCVACLHPPVFCLSCPVHVFGLRVCFNMEKKARAGATRALRLAGARILASLCRLETKDPGQPSAPALV